MCEEGERNVRWGEKCAGETVGKVMYGDEGSLRAWRWKRRFIEAVKECPRKICGVRRGARNMRYEIGRAHV